MSSETNGSHGQHPNEGIRLPSISFLAGTHPAPSQLASIVSPINNSSSIKKEGEQISQPGPQSNPIEPESEELAHESDKKPTIQDSSAEKPEEGTKAAGVASTEESELPKSNQSPSHRAPDIHNHHHHHHSPVPGHHHHHNSHQHGHHHHHHPPLPHPHHHHHRHSESDPKPKSSVSPQSQSAEVPPSTGSKRSSESDLKASAGSAKKKKDVKAFVAELKDYLVENFPKRSHLGSLTYNPTTTWDSIVLDQLSGLDSHERDELLHVQEHYIERLKEKSDEEHTTIPWLPQLSAANVNKTIQVKIQYKHIKEFIENFTLGRVQRKRELWGGVSGLYTDDSDLLSVLCHMGLFDNCLDLSTWNEGWKPADIVRPLHVEQDSDGVDLLDLSVTVLLLPGLSNYQGQFKNGINSRSWLGEFPHDGLSFAVYSVKWETFASSFAAKDSSKKEQAEFVADREASEKNFQESKGWKFDYKLAKETKEKVDSAKAAN